jgi:hypothetical protein
MRVRLIIELDDDVLESVKLDQIINADLTTSTGQTIENCPVVRATPNDSQA